MNKKFLEKKSGRILRKIIVFLGIFLFLLSVFSYFYIKNQLFMPLSKDFSEKIFEIKERQSTLEIVNNLKNQGFVKNKLITLAYIKLKNKKLKAGIYLLKRNLTPIEVLEIISSGRTYMRKITIIEGWTEKEIANYLDSLGIIKKDDFLEASKREKWNYDFLEGSSSLEGYLFPDTYYIPYNATSQIIIKKMLDNFSEKLNKDLREEIKKQGKTIKEIIILASIVEKEVSKDRDRKIVAGIFLKRLKEGKPLEADSTINYITGKNNPQPSYSDTRINSPFNTYINKGLPPSPISNPGLSSILAVIYPEDSEYWFYLNRQDTQETIFSKTYKEHLENKEKYLK